MAEKILLVEDEEKLARMVELELRYEGYEVGKVLDRRSGWLFTQCGPDAGQKLLDGKGLGDIVVRPGVQIGSAESAM